ncbi:HAD superfamily hydrolase [Levilactobacillus paucivorans]|uniref:HAD superfamily hydrolase n=1 Tax=Levilactobacillus paucivorans TaxID=616990 RepID=A0A0R2LY64_9LACO|nr:HAD-IIB family hydrolase [Levilactobacillus paucivorans]KRO03667.1 HAD superfamily hydrolase [Levilactobacillus paucivorans]
MRPRMIMTDLDGTFLDANGRYDRARLADQLTEMAAHQIRFVVTTGDPLGHVIDLFGDLELARDLVYVVEDGALTVTGNGEQLVCHPIPRDLWQTAVRWLRTAAVMAQPYLISCGRDQAYTDLPADSDRFHQSQVFYPQLTSVADLTAVVDPILKLDVTWLQADVTPFVAAFNDQFDGELVATSSGLGGLNVSLPGVNKASAVAELGRRWNIAPAEMVAFGDSGNDMAMLRLVGQGFAVANAATELINDSEIQQLPRTNQQGAVSAAIDSLLEQF